MPDAHNDNILMKHFLDGEAPAVSTVEGWQRSAVLAAGGGGIDVDDVVQTALTQLWRYIDRDGFHLTGSFRSLAVRIALARRIDAIRRIRFQADLCESIPDDTPTSLDSIETRECHEELYEAISRLRTLCRVLIRGRFFEGRSYEELAGITGRGASTLRVHLHRCLAALRSYYDVE